MFFFCYLGNKRGISVRLNIEMNIPGWRSHPNWLVRSNAETGESYSDISIQTREQIGIVIELKYADDGNLEAACKKALEQIEEKKYAEGLKCRGAKKLIKYGIAFCEKECMVMMA